MKNRSILALSIVFTPILASLCVPLSASASGWDIVSKIDHGLIAGTPKINPTVPVSLGSQGDDSIRPVTPENQRSGNADESIRPVVPGNERIGTDDSIRPVVPGNERIGTDDSVKPVTPSNKRTGQNNDSI
jgi:hypothetical protein